MCGFAEVGGAACVEDCFADSGQQGKYWLRADAIGQLKTAWFAEANVLPHVGEDPSRPTSINKAPRWQRGAHRLGTFALNQHLENGCCRMREDL